MGGNKLLAKFISIINSLPTLLTPKDTQAEDRENQGVYLLHIVYYPRRDKKRTSYRQTHKRLQHVI